MKLFIHPTKLYKPKKIKNIQDIVKQTNKDKLLLIKLTKIKILMNKE